VNILRGLLLFVEMLTCFLLITVILLQKAKGGGMGAMGGGFGESIFGTQMGNVMTKTTVILAIIFLVNTAILALLSSNQTRTPTVTGPPVPAGPVRLPSSGGARPGGGPAQPSSPGAMPAGPVSETPAMPAVSPGSTEPVVIDETPAAETKAAAPSPEPAVPDTEKTE